MDKQMTINLDQTFKPFGEDVFDFEVFNFPSGCEPHIKIKQSDFPKTFPVVITHRISSMNDLILVLLTSDALKRMGYRRQHLFIPYLPFARQDRIMVPGEPLSVKIVSDLINSCGFDLVKIFDPHSDVGVALIHNCEPISNSGFIKVVADMLNRQFTVVSPDSGAYKKIFNVCRDIKFGGIISICNKHRDVETGQINGMSCMTQNFHSSDVLIIDDICDGGGTFVGLAQELRSLNVGDIHLAISHGIFSKGIEALHNIDHIYITDSFKDVESSPKLTQIKLCNILT